VAGNQSGAVGTRVVRASAWTRPVVEQPPPSAVHPVIESERHSGGNTAIVTQGTGNPQEMPDWLRKQQGH
jgi:hypothetical protein